MPGLGDRLRLHRMHRGLTIEELAEMLGVDPGSIACGSPMTRRRNPTPIWLKPTGSADRLSTQIIRARPQGRALGIINEQT
ncbi:MAG: helix-turn-helix transcriptional regulator [Chromatiales bacterium]